MTWLTVLIFTLFGFSTWTYKPFCEGDFNGYKDTEWIRWFGSTHGFEQTGRKAHEFDLQVAVGAWLGTSSTVNALQMQNLIEAAQNGHVDLAIVGSEMLLRGDLTETQLIGYINQFSLFMCHLTKVSII